MRARVTLAAIVNMQISGECSFKTGESPFVRTKNVEFSEQFVSDIEFGPGHIEKLKQQGLVYNLALSRNSYSLK